jgi:replication factor C small subunit
MILNKRIKLKIFVIRMAEQIWTEKYRPEKLKDIVNQKHVIDALKAWAKEGSIPHMIFAGPAGSGKTTVALCVARELFGEHWRENFAELNASDERGIDVVRGRIKNFARTKPIGADFRIIFLDESDSLTPEAQQALRRTMEQFSNVARFIMSCNYSSKLIEPISSRCAVFRFKRLDKKSVEEYLSRIVEGEKLNAEKDAMETIYELSEGDLRKAVNLLQACSTADKITKEVVYNISAQARPKDIENMLNTVLNGNFTEGRKLLYSMLIEQGLSAEDIVKAIHRKIFELDIDEKKKIELIAKLGETEFRLNQGGTPEVQIEAFLAQLLNTKRG